jgi:hypothetical protein
MNGGTMAAAAPTVTANFTGPCTVRFANVAHRAYNCCKGLFRGHGVIIVNQQNTNTYDYYHIGTVKIDSVWSFQKSLGNEQGTIGSIITERVQGEIDYVINDVVTWNNVSFQKVNALVTNVLAQKAAVAQQPVPYQKAGNQRWGIWGGNGGHSCFTWVIEQLASIGLHVGSGIASSTKTPSPTYNTIINVTALAATVATAALVATKFIKKT